MINYLDRELLSVNRLYSDLIFRSCLFTLLSISAISMRGLALLYFSSFISFLSCKSFSYSFYVLSLFYKHAFFSSNSNLFQDPSPCYQVTCPFYGTCRLKKDGTLFCQCVNSCPKIYRPVCGSDGRSYFSECFLQSNACLLSKQITVAYLGHCSKFVYLIAFH